MFPIEVWEIIFEKINNPEDLTKLKLVCKDWYLSIENILSQKLKWKNHCLKLIPQENVFYTLIQMSTKPMKEIYHWNLNQNNYIWQEIFYSLKKWQLCGKRKKIIDNIINLQLNTPYERIICLSIYHENFGIATDEGFIYFYKICDTKKYFYRANNTQAVVQLDFWNAEDLIAVSRSICGRIRFWNLHTQQEAKTISKIYGNKIIIHINGCYVVHDNFIYKYSYANCKEITLMEEFPLYFNHTISVITTILYFDSIQMICSEKFSSNAIKFYNIDFDNNGCIFNKPTNLILPKELSLPVYKKFYTFYTTIIVTLSGPSISFCLNRMEWHTYILFNQLHGIVQCVCYHCKMLILGLDSGIIFIYYVENESDLKDFDFSPHNSKKIIVDNQPITSINVTDSNGKQFIIAATDQRVHIIQFF